MNNKVSIETQMQCLVRLGMLKFFPTKPAVVAEVGRFLNLICANDDEARRLTDVAIEHYTEWPGPAKLRETHWVSVLGKTTSECSVDPETAARIRAARLRQ